MIRKDTSKLLEELRICSDFNEFYESNASQISKTELSQILNDLLEKQGIKKSEAIRASELNEIYAYQIFSGKRIPERKKLLNLCIGMSISLEEVQDLLKHCGYAALYAKIPFDCIIIYGICKKMSVADINYLLYEYGEETLS